MHWNNISSEQDINTISEQSSIAPQVIFKHSTRCSISTMAKARLERSAQPENISFHYLDLLQHRDISNLIAEKFSVYHESPQILLIKNGECVYDESHNAIAMEEIVEQALL